MESAPQPKWIISPTLIEIQWDLSEVVDQWDLSEIVDQWDLSDWSLCLISTPILCLILNIYISHISAHVCSTYAELLTSSVNTLYSQLFALTL